MHAGVPTEDIAAGDVWLEPVSPKRTLVHLQAIHGRSE